MKTHEFSRHLEQLARLLRKLPNTELDSKSFASLQEFLPGLAPARKKATKSVRILPLDIQEQIASMSPAEIEKFLLSQAEIFTVANLLELAARIGITSSKRQSKNALINMIARHYEAAKMHSIMRSSNSNET